MAVFRGDRVSRDNNVSLPLNNAQPIEPIAKADVITYCMSADGSKRTRSYMCFPSQRPVSLNHWLDLSFSNGNAGFDGSEPTNLVVTKSPFQLLKAGT